MKIVAFIKVGISLQATAHISWTTSTIRIALQISEIRLIKFQSFSIAK